jgi:spermidine synthase
MPQIPRFEELDFQKTPIGDLILRKRTVLSLENQEIYEIILGNSFLMSSMFTVVEQELSRFGLAATKVSFPDEKLDVVVGGLGLGYTARAALEFPEVGTLRIVDYLKPVIEWHEKEMVPLGKGLNDDPRCQYVLGDFFELSLGQGYDPEIAQFHAVLLDIDHSPAHLLTQDNARFYSTAGLRKFADRIKPGGVFGLWSDDPPEEEFLKSLSQVFESVESHIVPFHNPIQDEDFESTVYVATKAR